METIKIRLGRFGRKKKYNVEEKKGVGSVYYFVFEFEFEMRCNTKYLRITGERGCFLAKLGSFMD